MNQPVSDSLRPHLHAPTADDGRLAIARFAPEKTIARGGFVLTSPAFKNGEELDPCFTADEEDAVAPPLEWTAPPPGTQELAIVVQDADAEGDALPIHWLVWGLPGQKGKLLEGETPPRVGKNGKGNSEWLLPAPPQEDEAHRFVFQIFALDLPLTLMPGATQKELFANIENHVLACSVVTGTYKRADEDDFEWEEEAEDGGDLA